MQKVEAEENKLGLAADDIKAMCAERAQDLGQAAVELATCGVIQAREEAEKLIYASEAKELWDERLKLRTNKNFDKVFKAAQSTLMQMQSGVYESAGKQIEDAVKSLESVCSEYLLPKYDGAELDLAGRVKNDCIVCTATGLILALSARDMTPKQKSGKMKAIKSQKMNSLPAEYKEKFPVAVIAKSQDMENMLE